VEEARYPDNMAVSGSQLNENTWEVDVVYQANWKTVTGLERVAIEVSDEQPSHDGYWFRELC
jgi:hypothetical protein